MIPYNFRYHKSEIMVKFKFIYNRKNKLKKDGTGLIQLELYKNRTRRLMSTDIYIKPEEWDSNSSKVYYSNSRADEYNMTLHDIIKKIESILRHAKLKEKDFSIDEILELMVHNESDSLANFMLDEIEKDQRISEKTKRDLLNTRKRILEFNSKVRLQDINFKFISDFDNYLRVSGYSINTIGKLHKNLKRFLNLAIKYNMLSQGDYPYRNFKVERESTTRESLTYDELIAIESVSYESTSINNQVKNMFLFACYTGLRISDVIRLKTTDCKKSSSGWVLEFRTFKVSKLAYIPIHSLFSTKGKYSKPEIILCNYYSSNKELIFPKVPEATINRHLKEIAKQAGITKNVTFHMGRHTFGTIMASRIPLPTLQSLMQHSDIKTTMIYVNMSNQIIDENLGKIDWNN